MLVIPFPWAFVPLKMQLAAKQNDFHKRNLEASQNRCSALLEDIFHPLEENVKQGVYSKPRGHCLFIQQRDELKAKYNQELRKGIQAEEALQKYLESKESMSVTILQTDLALTAMEKEIEGEGKMGEKMQHRNSTHFKLI